MGEKNNRRTTKIHCQHLNTMESLANTIIGLSTDNQADFTKLQHLFKTSHTMEILAANKDQIDVVLFDAFNPSVQTYAYVHLLSVKANFPIANVDLYVKQVERLLEAPNPIQLSRCTLQLKIVCTKYVDILLQPNSSYKPMRGIKPLKQAITQSRKSPEHLTALHAQFTKLCLVSKCYHFALPLLQEDLFEFDRKGMNTTDYLLYFYYGGLVFVGMKRFSDAFNFFKRAFTAPAYVPSAIMVESYKKYALVSLILYGEIRSLPHYTSPVVSRHLKTVCKPYIEFGLLYAKNDVAQLREFYLSNQELIQQDNNVGLIKQAINSSYEQQIKMRTKCFLTLSLQDIAEGVKLPSIEEAEKYVLRMIEEGKICATINQKDGMVSFNDDPEQFNNNQFRDLMHERINKSIQLSQRVQNLNEGIKTSNTYLQKTLEGRSWGESYE